MDQILSTRRALLGSTAAIAPALLLASCTTSSNPTPSSGPTGAQYVALVNAGASSLLSLISGAGLMTAATAARYTADVSTLATAASDLLTAASSATLNGWVSAGEALVSLIASTPGLPAEATQIAQDIDDILPLVGPALEIAVAVGARRLDRALLGAVRVADPFTDLNNLIHGKA
jgi:hypothetical protein